MGQDAAARAGRLDRPLSVVVVTGALFPERMRVWRACADAGVAVSVVGTLADVYRGRWPWRPSLPEGLSAYPISPRSPAVSRGHLWWWYPGLGALLRRIRPDVVHVISEPWGLLVLQSLAARGRGERRFRACAHGADNLYAHGSLLERATRGPLLRAVLPRLDGFASWNTEGVRLARASGLSVRTPTVVVPAAVPHPEAFRPGPEEERADARRAFGLPAGGVVVGFVGRLVAEKGPLDLLRAVRSLGGEAPFLAVWGSGPLEARISRELGEAAPGRFLGPLEMGKVPNALRACDLVAVPSRRTPEWQEQFGRVAVEAMLSGCAVVAYRSGALPDVVGDGGVVVPEGDVSALADAIGRLARDPIAREDVARRGRESALRRYHPDTLAGDVIRFWSEVVSR